MLQEDQAKIFLEFCAKKIATKHNGDIIRPKVISVAGRDRENFLKCPRIFIRKDLVGLRSSRAVVVVELAASNHLLSGKCICYCRVWLLLSSHEIKSGSVNAHPTKHRNKKGTPLKVCEIESSMLGNLVTDFCEDLNLESKMFDFGVQLIEDTMRPKGRDICKRDVMPLVKDMKLRFPLSWQTRTLSLGKRIMHKTIHFESSFDASRLFHYICLNLSSYNVVKCDGRNGCLSRMMREMDTDVYFFFIPHAHIIFAFEFFVLCRTEGESMDSFIHNGSSPYIQTISEKIMWVAETSMKDIIRSAAVNLRRDCLWEGFSHSNQSKCLIPIDSLHEMCQMSHTLSISGLSPQLSELLFDRMDKLEILWSNVLLAMKRDPVFSLSASFDDRVYLFYFKQEDLFLMIELNSSKGVEEIQILTRENPSENKLFTNSCNSIIDVITNWILHWLWNSL